MLEEKSWIGQCLWHLRSSHLVSGDPMKPSGQAHWAWCLMTRQMALGAQGLSSLHGSMHFRLRHDR